MTFKTSTIFAVVVTFGLCANLFLLTAFSQNKFFNGFSSPSVTLYKAGCSKASPSNMYWYQVGNSIHGSNSFYRSKKSVSISPDGTVVAVGGGHGKVHIYAWNSVHWKQLGSDLEGDIIHISFGNSISLSSDGRTVAIDGAGSHEGSYIYGRVGVYTFNGSDWNQVGGYIDGNAHGFFGHSVSLSFDGYVLAVGAISDSIGVACVKVYHWNGAIWMQRGASINTRGVSGYNDKPLGSHSVALSSDGQTVVVGNSYGLVSVYSWDGSVWDQIGNYISGSSEVVIGCSVSISCGGRTIAFGSLNDTTGGQVNVYSWDGMTWNQVGNAITGEDAEIMHKQTVSLSCDGSTVATGAAASSSSDNSEGEGRVRIFTWNGNVWSQVGTNIQGSVSAKQSEYSISLSSDGSKVVIGENGFASAGGTRIYSICSEQ